MHRKSAHEHMLAAVHWSRKAAHLSLAGVWCSRASMALSVGALAFAIHAPSSDAAFLALFLGGAGLTLLGRWLVQSAACKWHVISRFHLYAALGEDPCAQGCPMCIGYGVATLPQYVIDDRRALMEGKGEWLP